MIRLVSTALLATGLFACTSHRGSPSTWCGGVVGCFKSFDPIVEDVVFEVRFSDESGRTLPARAVMFLQHLEDGWHEIVVKSHWPEQFQSVIEIPRNLDCFDFTQDGTLLPRGEFQYVTIRVKAKKCSEKWVQVRGDEEAPINVVLVCRPEVEGN